MIHYYTYRNTGAISYHDLSTASRRPITSSPLLLFVYTHTPNNSKLFRFWRFILSLCHTFSNVAIHAKRLDELHLISHFCVYLLLLLEIHLEAKRQIDIYTIHV